MTPWGDALQAPGSGFGGGRLLKRRFRVERVAIFMFSGVLEKMASPKAKAKALANLNFVKV